MNYEMVIGAVFLPVLISFFVTLLPQERSVKDTQKSFFLADQSLHSWQILNLFLSTSLALGGAIIYFAWLGYKVGAGALVLQGCWCVGLYWLSQNAHKIRRVAGEGTLHAAVGRHYGKRVAFIAALATVFGFTFNLGIEVLAVGTLLKSVTESKAITVAITLALVFSVSIYTATKGMKGNVLVNQIQNGLSLLALTICIVAIAMAGPEMGIDAPDAAANTPVGLVEFLTVGGLLSSIFLNLLWQIGDMSAWQSVSASDETSGSAKIGVRWAVVVVFLVGGVMPTLIGVMLQGHNLGDEAQLFSTLINILSTQPVLLALVITGLVCAMLSTIDGFMLSASQAVVQDIFYQEQDSINSLTLARVSIVVLSLAGAFGVLALNEFSQLGVFNLVYLGYTSQIALVAAAWCILRGWNIEIFGAVSIFGGLLSGAGIVIYGLMHSDSGHFVIWGPFAAFGVSSLIAFAGVLRKMGNASKGQGSQQ